MKNELTFMGSVPQNQAAESITSQGAKMMSSKHRYQDFGNYMERATDNRKAETEVKNSASRPNSNNKQNVKKSNAYTKNTGLDNKNQKLKDTDEQSITSAESETVAKASETSETSEIKNSDKPLAEEAAVKEIAELLGIPQERILEILNSLNLSVFDLKDKAAMLDFMKNIHNVSDVSELLTIPNIKDSFVQIEGIINEAQILPNEIISFDEAVLTNAAEPAVSVHNNIEQKNVSLETEQIIGETSVNDVSKPVDANVEPTKAAAGESETAEVIQGNVIDNQSESQQDDFHLTEQAPSEPLNAVNVQQGMSYTASKEQGHNSYDGQDSESNADIIPQNVDINFTANSNVVFREVQQRSLAASNIDTQDVVNQIVEKMKVEIKANITEVKLLLKPESLGEVSLKISIENGIITANFVAENQRVKEIIESNFNQLKDTLQQQGLNISELNVSVGQDKAQERLDAYNQSRRKNASRIQQIINGIASEDEADAAESAVDNLEDRIVDIMA